MSLVCSHQEGLPHGYSDLTVDHKSPTRRWRHIMQPRSKRSEVFLICTWKFWRSVLRICRRKCHFGAKWTCNVWSQISEVYFGENEYWRYVTTLNWGCGDISRVKCWRLVQASSVAWSHLCSMNIQLYYPGILPWTTFDFYFTKHTVQAELATLETSSG